MTADWRIGDAVLAVLSGLFAGAFAFAAIGTIDPTPFQTFGIILPAQEAASFATFWMLSRRRGIARPFAKLGIPPRRGLAWLILVGVGLAVVATLALNILVDFEEAPQEIARIAEEATGVTAVLAFIGSVLLAPVVEEIIFRGVLLRGLQRRMPFSASAIVSSAAFAAFHFNGPDTLVILPPLFILGVILAVAARRLGVGAAIYVHSGFNLLAAVTFFL
ncbi:MAG: CPBP family intramembrane metalloprotease [Acidimicrobiia bacterium]|nr:CPBP family intramembrane metalloprotease [Acidimicrobiia bacterium]